MAERVEDEIVRHRITPWGEEMQGHLRELVGLMKEMGVEEGLTRGRRERHWWLVFFGGRKNAQAFKSIST